MGTHTQSSTGTAEGEKGISFATYCQSTSSSRMNSDAESGIFVHISTPADFNNNPPSRRDSHGHRHRRETTRESQRGDGPPDQLENRAVSHPPADTANFQTVSRVLGVSKEGKMDVAGFLDALC